MWTNTIYSDLCLDLWGQGHREASHLVSLCTRDNRSVHRFSFFLCASPFYPAPVFFCVSPIELRFRALVCSECLVIAPQSNGGSGQINSIRKKKCVSFSFTLMSFFTCNLSRNRKEHVARMHVEEITQLWVRNMFWFWQLHVAAFWERHQYASSVWLKQLFKSSGPTQKEKPSWPTSFDGLRAQMHFEVIVSFGPCSLHFNHNSQTVTCSHTRTHTCKPGLDISQMLTKS